MRADLLMLTYVGNSCQNSQLYRTAETTVQLTNLTKMATGILILKLKLGIELRTPV